MNRPDDQINKEFRPLHIPLYFNPSDSKQDKVIYALAQIGSGSVEDIIMELSRQRSSVDPVPYLQVLFDKGLIKGEMTGGVMKYNLGT